MNDLNYYQHVYNKILNYIEDINNGISLIPVASTIYKYRSDVTGLNSLCEFLEKNENQNQNERYKLIVDQLQNYTEKRNAQELLLSSIFQKISEDAQLKSFEKIIQNNKMPEYSRYIYDTFLQNLSKKEKEDFCGFMIYNDDYVKYARLLNLSNVGNAIWTVGGVEEELLRLCDMKNYLGVLDYVANLSEELEEASQNGYSFDETITSDDAIVLNRLFGSEIFVAQEDDRIITPEIGEGA